ncbi:SusC/RagA family TonB-linked outer membrane protein [Mucilaginibacter sp. BJC16-A38]|uniref:SusC/RagA family TonB-linked outer membrane protein n=1 Tax=Mucilaginibacter phenanthrenivorans TaxID=1234842 RepID=UPI00215872BA|nr:SusC/RagA family TonB-linked outer membrane protein [Mucilaginibacter phenanthrenivorans]MCR8560255.1 SusC/RagA family TonB-linked outer membrane protein [Mucilaginibacter phenanthrenivorans]
MKHLSKLCFLVLFYFIVGSAMAQNTVITGKVTDKKDGSVLSGVSISPKPGSPLGTVTDANGDFKLSLPAGTPSLTFSFIGYNTQVVSILNKTVVNVSLITSSNNLNEVVVIGYGSQKVKDATGSVASLNPKDFNKGIIATPDQLIEGRIPGVQVTQSSGEPGGGASINIRGTSSIRAGSDPLYVIDGVPITNDTYPASSPMSPIGSSSSRSPLEFLNPNDIENISILKDASASAIYGSRGANGVILITTRKGRKGQGIQFSEATTISHTANRYDLLNASQFVAAVNGTGADASAINKGANTDWQNQIFRTSVSQNFNLGFGGAKDQFTYRASLGYDDENGVIRNSGLRKFSGHFNASQNLFKDVVKLDLSLLGSNVKDQFAPISNNAGFTGSLIGATIGLNPTYPIKNPDGTYYFDGSALNPVAMLNLTDDRDNVNRVLANIGITVKLAKGLSYKGTFGDDVALAKRRTYYDPNIPGYTSGGSIRGVSTPSISGSGSGALQTVKLSSQITEQTLNYEKKWTDKSALTILAGYSYQVFKNFSFNDVRFNTSTKNVLKKDLNDFTKRYPIFGDSTKSELQSYYGRVNYSFEDRFLLTATVRSDGSSKFGKNNKYATFPAAAVKWKVINEDWAPKNTFDDLSLRINYGQTGNQEFPPYQSLSVFQTTSSGSSQLYSPNPDLRWETTTQTGAGIDFTILHGRLSGTIDYFHKDTKDLLFFQYFSAPAPSPGQWINLPGDVINNGLEFGINFGAVQGKKFSWDIAYNMTFLKNNVKNFKQRVVQTGAIDGQGLSGAFAQVIQNNYPLFTFKVSQYNGLDADGFGIYPNGIDGQTLQGSALPTFTASLTNNFTYGNWNLSVFLNAVTGFYVYDNTANAYFYRGSLLTGHNVTKDVAFTNENPLNSGQVSTRWLEKGDFLRVSNVSLGYTVPMAGGKVFKSLRFSLSGQNLALFTAYKGLDPEINTNKAINSVPSRGIDYTAYPRARTITFGLNAGF